MAAPIDPRLLQRSRAVRLLLCATVLVGAATALVVVAQAWWLAQVVAGLVEGGVVRGALLALAGALVVRGALGWAQAALSARAAARVKAGLRHDLVDAALDPARVTGPPDSARLAALLERGLDGLDGYVGRYLPQLVLTVVVPVAVLVALVVADPLSAVIVALTLPLVVVFLVLVGLATSARTDRRWEELQRLGRHFSEVLDGLAVLSVFGRDQERGLREVGRRHRRSAMRALRSAFLSSLVLELFSTLSVALVAVAAGLRMVGGSVDLATGLFVIVVAPEAYLALRRLGTLYHDGAEGLAAADEAFTLLGTTRPDGRLPAPDAGPVEICGLVVRRAGRRAPALTVRQARIEVGEVLAVDGPSGSGKSTLLGVLLGFVEPERGRVRVAGRPLEDLDAEDWRRRIAWVPQDPAVTGGTIADAVRQGAPEATDRQVRRALDDAGGRDLPLNRWVGEGGRHLSAGERRRVAVARAVLRVRHGQAWLVLLDEPTAGLDRAHEQRILRTVRSLGVSVVLVTHRAETLAAADRRLRIESPAVAS